MSMSKKIALALIVLEVVCYNVKTWDEFLAANLVIVIMMITSVGISALPLTEKEQDETSEAVALAWSLVSYQPTVVEKYTVGEQYGCGGCQQEVAHPHTCGGLDYDTCDCGECWNCKGYHGDEGSCYDADETREHGYYDRDLTQETPWADTQEFDAEDIRTEAMKDFDDCCCYAIAATHDGCGACPVHDSSCNCSDDNHYDCIPF